MNAPESESLCHDVSTILIQCHRDRQGDGIFAPGIAHEDLSAFAQIMARRLAPMIGGRYIPKHNGRAARDSAVWGSFTGNNREAVMRQFRISRALFYSIMSRRPKPGR